MPAAQPITPITLSQLCAQISDCLSDQFGQFPIALRAEISSIKQSKGHCYLTLIETSPKTGLPIAEMRAQIWAGQYARIRKDFENQTDIELCQGLKLLFYGQLNYSERYGLSFNITDIDSGYTLGQIELEKTKNLERIRAEGLDKLNALLPKPTLMRRVAVISAANADGFSDLCLKLKENQFGYFFSVTLFEAALQGVNAVPSMLAALSVIKSQANRFDCLVIVRGGGDATHLHCFNDLELSLAIAHFPLRVITGIGHSTDLHLADQVASRSCATPTDVAFFLVEQVFLLENQILQIADKLADVAKEIYNSEQNSLLYFSNKISAARSELVLSQTHALNRLGFRVHQSLKKELETRFLQISKLQNLLTHATPKLIKQTNRELESFQIRLPIFAKSLIVRQESDLNHYSHLTKLLGIDQTLARGYSLLKRQGHIIDATAELLPTDKIEILGAHGIVYAEIIAPES